jgi:hypothetical protein
VTWSVVEQAGKQAAVDNQSNESKHPSPRTKSSESSSRLISRSRDGVPVLDMPQ